MPALGRIAWVPKGPTGQLPGSADELPPPLLPSLMQSDITLLITDPWRKAADECANAVTPRSRPRTIWIDVGAGKKPVWDALDSRFRQGIRRGQRVGITTESTQSPEDIERFFALCCEISKVKGFRLPASFPLMMYLLERGRKGDIETRLFVARCEGRLLAGVFIIRCGCSTHFIWGATDRNASKERVGEAVHWAALEWFLSSGCNIHDLEGIDPERNPGVYAFKKKMGGVEITLAGKHYYPLSGRGRLLAWLDARFR